MFDVSTFLLRWVFLSNLTRDLGDIQTIPQQQQQVYSAQNVGLEYAWRDYCINGILQYPPGIQRGFTLDALRLELVQQLEDQWMSNDALLLLHRNQRQQQSSRDDATTEQSGNANVQIPSDADDNDSRQREDTPPPSSSLLLPHPLPPASSRHIRTYIPQLVSGLLHSPPTTCTEFPALAHLRSILLQRCQDDPSFGIEMCWLLEAQVGRTWRTLLEHSSKQRLLVLLPAEQAAVLARMSRDKQQAFTVLQQAEQATAYGRSLPASIGERRCAHFGDTMHWMDRLSQLSADLRHVPKEERMGALEDALEESNRRIRRRMVSRGTVSLEVEDQLRADDWPRIDDMSLDVIDHSIHLPLVPQKGIWPNGETDEETSSSSSEDEVVRVLNIVVSESRILSSRERCPFLIHVEVADSGLEGSDARLFTAGTTGLGATMEEAFATPEATAQLGTSSTSLPVHQDNESPKHRPRYAVPRELVQENSESDEGKIPVPAHAFFTRGGSKASEGERPAPAPPFLARGGSSTDSSYHSNYDAQDTHFYDPLNNMGTPLRPQLYHHHHQEQQPHQHYDYEEQPEPQQMAVGLDLLDSVFGRKWEEKCREIRSASPYGHVKGWRLASFIMKAGEDIRRESFVMQIITKMQNWFDEEISEHNRPFMRPYTIMCVGADAGLLECLSDAKSIDEIKKTTEGFVSLRDYFIRAYGPPQRPNTRRPLMNQPQNFQLPLSHPSYVQDPETETPSEGNISFEEAQENFLRSLVGYSLVCYVLQIKDRHNANILLDRLGNIIHIDFGFVLGDTPKMGKVPIFSERAPFKLSTEFWDVVGGWKGLGARFCKMFELAFHCASRHVDEIASLTEASMLSMDYNARTARAVANGVRSRLRMRGPLGSKEQQLFVAELVNTALQSWGTNTYDWLQRNMNGYL